MSDIGPGLTTDVTETETSTGYLPVQGEIHYEEDCQYVRSGPRLVIRRGRQVRAYVLTRECACQRRLPADEEYHFDSKCNWRRIKDQGFDFNGEQKVYIYRRCVCQEPR